METLEQIWQRLKDAGYETDKGSIHSYIPVYEKLLEPYRETALNVLEIGLFNGNSMRMWCEYFTEAKIHGIDCSLTPHDGMADLKPLLYDINVKGGMNAKVHIFDAENEQQAKEHFKKTKFDVIIDDAGHEINQQINLVNIWFPYLTKKGIYIIEDIQDIDKTGNLFAGIGGHIIDRRSVKGRYDDVIVILEDPAKIQRP